MNKIHYADNYILDEFARDTLRREELHLSAKLCDGKHPKIGNPEPTNIKNHVTCLKCLKRLTRTKVR